MKKRFLLLVFVFLFMFALQIASYGTNGEPVWLVEPTLEYNYIYYCGACNLFGTEPLGNINTDGVERDPNLLNVEANLAKYKYENGSAYVSVGHGMTTSWYFYDANNDGFIICSSGDGGGSIEYFTRDEFVNEIYWNRMIAVRETNVDLSEINGEYLPGDDDAIWHSIFESQDGNKYALMYGGRFITGFVYDDFKSRGNRYMPRDFIDVNSNGKWGIADKNGNATAFFFEDIEFINGDFAFAKYNGKYGVLDLKATLQINAPATGGSGIFSLVVLAIAAAILILSKRFRIMSTANPKK